MVETLLRPSHTSTGPAADGTAVVALRGEIDIFVAPPLTACLDDLTATGRPDLVVDLRAVSFIDCAGLRPLCRTQQRVMERQGRLRLVTNSDHLLRILRAAGLADAFEICDRLPDGLTPGPGQSLA
ncbi:STAS domain-containing protein [Streptomyces sp. NPDC086787]|uniref:STAS domain-containing protein n=1 Tax=Streptomyces sp. NPDC086787 TaxID=3365759 RepID=UPI00380306F1